MFTEAQKAQIAVALAEYVEMLDGHEPFVSFAVSAAEKIASGKQGLNADEIRAVRQAVKDRMMMVVEEEDGEAHVDALVAISDAL